MDGTHFGILIAVIAGWNLVIVATARWMMTTTVKTLDVRFQAMEKKVEEGLVARQCTEREFLQLRADLPMTYVRREDDIRKETVFHDKLDALALKMERLLMKEANHERNGS